MAEEGSDDRWLNFYRFSESLFISFLATESVECSLSNQLSKRPEDVEYAAAGVRTSRTKHYQQKVLEKVVYSDDPHLLKI